MENSINLQKKRKITEASKEYMKKYYRVKYNTDPEYREKVKERNKKLYKNKTVKCCKCFVRKLIDDVTFNKEKKLCSNCIENAD